MDLGLITIVVPVYKTEKFLNQCIDSLVNQTYRNLEIILVDDGSPDNCPQICDAWAEVDSRIQVIHGENEGASLARNKGIKKAKGRFICFCDSDDFLSLDSVEKSYQKIMQTEAEIVVYGFNCIGCDGILQSSFVPRMENVYEGESIRNVLLPELIAPDPNGDGLKRIHMSNWVLLCSVELIRRNGWQFASERNIYSEDVYSLLELFFQAKRVAILPEALYFYRITENSISRKYVPNRFERIKTFYFETQKLTEKLGCSKILQERLKMPFLSFTIAAMKQDVGSTMPFDQKIKHVIKVVEDDVLQSVLLRTSLRKMPFARKMLLWAMRNKLAWLCYLLITIRNCMAEK